MIKKIVIVVLIFSSIVVLHFMENIKGYYSFKEYCKNDSGIKERSSLESNVGWVAKGYHDALFLAGFKEVRFARFTDKRGGKTLKDLHYVEGGRRDRRSFEKVEADLSENIIYRLVSKREVVEGVPRLSKISYQVVNEGSGNVLIGFYDFSYSMFNRERTLLAAPSFMRCGGANEFIVHSFKNFFNS